MLSGFSDSLLSIYVYTEVLSKVVDYYWCRVYYYRSTLCRLACLFSLAVYPKILVRTFESVLLSKTKADAVEQAKEKISRVPNFLHIPEIDFVTGERVVELCDVAFYPKEYVEAYPSVRRHARNIVYVEPKLRRSRVQLIRRSHVFYVRPDDVRYFGENIVTIIPRYFVLVTHQGDVP